MNTHFGFLALALVALTVYRAAILITRDDFPFGRPRDWLARNYRGSFVDLWFCPWCVSMWLGAGATVLSIYCWSWFQYVCLVFASSAVAGFLSEHS